jgi:hypothetical protein
MVQSNLAGKVRYFTNNSHNTGFEYTILYIKFLRVGNF